MTSSLAAQLSQIAVNSTNSLNIKAQKASHAKSLLFEPRVAASQTFDTIYILCHEGFQELCLLDSRFLEYQRNIFSDQSQNEDRTQMTITENSELDQKLESFLGLVGEKLMLTPGLKAVEWLIRRFRVHEYNTSFLLTTFLPYYSLPIFTKLLSILPIKIPDQYSFLQPYIRSLTPPTRHIIVNSATNQISLFTALNAYTLRLCGTRHHYPAFISFWAGIIAEATNAMLDKSKSGRVGIQKQNEEDIVLRLLPMLNEGLAMKKVPDLRIGCYMLVSILAAKAGLDDKLLTALMEAVVLGWTAQTTLPAIVCLCILAQQRGAKQITKRITKELLKVQDLTEHLIQLAKDRRVDRLCNGLCLALVDRVVKQGDASGLPTIVSIIQNQLLSEPQASVIIKSLVLAAYRLDGSEDSQDITIPELSKSLVALAQSGGRIGFVVEKALEDTSVDIDDLELKLHAKIMHKRLPKSEDTQMEESDPGIARQDFSDIYDSLMRRRVTESSCLSNNDSEIYLELCDAFVASISDSMDLDIFDASPVLRRISALQEAFYFSFYMRVWCEPHPVMARVSALHMVTRYLSNNKGLSIDMQAILPYAISALCDPAGKVRHAAAALLVQLEQFYPTDIGSKSSLNPHRWAADDIYGMESQEIKWLSKENAIHLLKEVLIPTLEECILDKNNIEITVRECLSSNRIIEGPKTVDAGRLSQATRLAIFSFLATHTVHTPSFSVKFKLLSVLNQIQSIGSTTRTKLLLPILQTWASLSPSDAIAKLQLDQLTLNMFDEQAVLIVTPGDKDSQKLLAHIVKGELAADRKNLIKAVFKRLKQMWPSFKNDVRLRIVQMLMKSAYISLDVAVSEEVISDESIDFLRTVPLSTEILLSFLSELPTAPKMADNAPAAKRRRTSHGEVAATTSQDQKKLSEAIQEVTFILQLIDNSNPRSHPALLKPLFNTLAELQHFKAQLGSELAYLQGLLLSSLLEILKFYKENPDTQLDRSSVRSDLLVDCVQKTNNPQVQNTALLIISALADLAPELVLHSVMPIFTFMGNSLLRQSDDYSAFVISQTIRDVIPPLVASLRKAKGNPVTGAAELLLSFVAAYEHVPSHRRNSLFKSLMQTLGAEDFLYALLAMLAGKYGMVEDIKSFISGLSSSFSVEIQLQTALKSLELVKDVLKPHPTLAGVLLATPDGDALDPEQVAMNELLLITHLLSHRRLISQTGKLLSQDDMDAARTRDIYSNLLESLLSLADSLKERRRLYDACGDVLEMTLGLLSTTEFIKSVDGLLDRSNESLRRKILLSLEVRIDHERVSDTASRISMLGFLPQLTAIVRDSKDVLYKHTAVACIEKISQKYGKKDTEAVTAAAETISSPHCLGQSDKRLQIMSLLCLASLTDILQDGVISVLPTAIPKALAYMEDSISQEEKDSKLHIASYAFISSLVRHVPYMISGAYLDKLLVISNASAQAYLDDDVVEGRLHCLHLATRRIDAKSLFVALESNWEAAFKAGTLAIREYFEILSTAVEGQPKSVVTKNTSSLVNIFQGSLDLRRKLFIETSSHVDASTTTEIEFAANSVAIKMIYKLNDSTFRPIFADLVKWATSTLPKRDKLGQMLRLQSLYGFMKMFFDNLQSIVTSYGSYLIDNAVAVLKDFDYKNEEFKTLWSTVLETLMKCFEHDQDDFWQSPTHFSVIAPVLCEQFTRASILPLETKLIPTLVELASAADSSDNHKEINGAILEHLRSPNSSVRLVAVKCEQALTDRLGEEWLSMLPEMLPYISELQEDDDDTVEQETHRWIVKIEGVLGESLDAMLQ